VEECSALVARCGLIPCRRLPQSEYRTPITALAGFIPAHEAPGVAQCVAPLCFEIVTSLSEIEPNHGVARTMPLRLGFVAEWRKRDRLHATGTTQDERSDQQWNRKPKQPSSMVALAPDLSVT
jgi:hypothetical protein